MRKIRILHNNHKPQIKSAKIIAKDKDLSVEKNRKT